MTIAFCHLPCGNRYFHPSAMVYCKAFKRKIRFALVFFYKGGKETTRKIYLSMTAQQAFAAISSRKMDWVFQDE